MGLRSAIPFGKAFLKAKLLRRRTPLIVSWLVTRRCNYRCGYCESWRDPGEELAAEQVCDLVDEFAREGTRQVIFTGGEPLVKEGIERIVERCAERDIRVGINSNGALVPRKLPDLDGLRTLTLSLDGPEAVQDKLRGAGCFRDVMSALEAARSRDLRLRLLTVLSSENLDDIPFVLETARSVGARVFFQPATEQVLRGEHVNPYAPEIQAYRRAMDDLIAEKESGERGTAIAHSVTGLCYLRQWPNDSPMRCAGGLLFCRVTPAGNLKICGQTDIPPGDNNCAAVGVRKAFEAIPITTCAHCWCASRLEVNQLMTLKLDVARNALGLE
ncbi:MAG: radical SAM protein [Armatimonadota bacterium]